MDCNQDLRERLSKYLCIVMECFLNGSTEAMKDAKQYWFEAGSDYNSERSTKEIRRLYNSVMSAIDIVLMRSGQMEQRVEAPRLMERLTNLQQCVKAL